MTHHHHRDSVYVDLVQQSLSRELVQVTNIGNSHVIHKHANIQSFQAILDVFVKSFFLRICKICNYAHNLDFLVDLLQGFCHFLHLLLVSGQYADIEPQRG